MASLTVEELSGVAEGSRIEDVTSGVVLTAVGGGWFLYRPTDDVYPADALFDDGEMWGLLPDPDPHPLPVMQP